MLTDVLLNGFDCIQGPTRKNRSEIKIVLLHNVRLKKLKIDVTNASSTKDIFHCRNRLQNVSEDVKMSAKLWIFLPKHLMQKIVQ